ncbi:MAG: PhnD/SsuA/transferrin family substrate-binding protein [Cyanobacteria bacterium P01_A01_bin.83]
MSWHRILLIIIIFTVTACDYAERTSKADRPVETIIRKYSVGIVSYGENEKSLQQYADFQDYLARRLNSLIELEPAYNEVRALQQVKSKKWDLVFAPPGLAAIAIESYNYEPLVPIEGRDQSRSVIVSNKAAPFTKRRDLIGETIALGQKGSATGYYLPIYNLYGINFSQVRYAPTPQTILQWLEEKQVTVGALSLAEFNLLKRDYAPNTFKIVYLDQRDVPSGAILISDRIERNQQEQIKLALMETPSFIAATAGYLPNEQISDYDYLTKVIKRVQEVLEKSPMVLQK